MRPWNGLIWPGQRQATSYCEGGNEPLVSVKFRLFFN